MSEAIVVSQDDYDLWKSTMANLWAITATNGSVNVTHDEAVRIWREMERVDAQLITKYELPAGVHYHIWPSREVRFLDDAGRRWLKRPRKYRFDEGEVKRSNT